MLRRVEFEGEARMRAVHARGKGALLFTGHFGYWEINAMAHGAALWPMGVLARPLDNIRLHRLLERMRGCTGNYVIYRRGALRRVLKALAANDAVAMLIDQHIQAPDAVTVSFFDRPAATTLALAILAQRTGAPVIPVFALPTGPGPVSAGLRTPRRSAGRRLARGDPRLHAAVQRRAGDVRPPPSRVVAVDAPPLARRGPAGRRRARDVS